MQDEPKKECAQLDKEANPFKKVVTPLANGLLKIYEPDLKQVEKTLKELTEKELSLFDEIHNENLSLSTTQHSDELNEMFKKVELYQVKLTNIKKEMKSLHDKSIKLKKRVLKLQQFREKQEYIKQQKEAQIKIEQSLIGKSGTNT